MNITIVGDGKVGYTLAQFLSKDGHDITIIDKDETALARAADTLDVMCIRGNGANMRTLLEADIENCDIDYDAIRAEIQVYIDRIDEKYRSQAEDIVNRQIIADAFSSYLP